MNGNMINKRQDGNKKKNKKKKKQKKPSQTKLVTAKILYTDKLCEDAHPPNFKRKGISFQYLMFNVQAYGIYQRHSPRKRYGFKHMQHTQQHTTRLDQFRISIAILSQHSTPTLQKLKAMYILLCVYTRGTNIGWPLSLSHAPSNNCSV